MTSKGKAAKFYQLTPKAYRTMWALEKFDEELARLNKIPDEEILKIAEKKLEAEKNGEKGNQI